jgi:hypothetical protein
MSSMDEGIIWSANSLENCGGMHGVIKMPYALHGDVNSISFAATFPLYCKCPLGMSCRFRVRYFDKNLLSWSV